MENVTQTINCTVCLKRIRRGHMRTHVEREVSDEEPVQTFKDRVFQMLVWVPEKNLRRVSDGRDTTRGTGL